MIYPITNNYNGDGVIPLAMREADEILRKSIYESYSIKRLWNERDYFMKQERDMPMGMIKLPKMMMMMMMIMMNLIIILMN